MLYILVYQIDQNQTFFIMAEYLINTSSFLGYQCCGASVYADGSGYVTLSDKQVSDLVELIKKNGGESDPEILDLKDNLPEIYNILDKAYHDTAYKTEYRHWLLEGDMDDVYYRDDNFMERLEEDGLFLFEFDEEEYRGPSCSAFSMFRMVKTRR